MLSSAYISSFEALKRNTIRFVARQSNSVYLDKQITPLIDPIYAQLIYRLFENNIFRKDNRTAFR